MFALKNRVDAILQARNCKLSMPLAASNGDYWRAERAEGSRCSCSSDRSKRIRQKHRHNKSKYSRTMKATKGTVDPSTLMHELCTISKAHLCSVDPRFDMNPNHHLHPNRRHTWNTNIRNISLNSSAVVAGDIEKFGKETTGNIQEVGGGRSNARHINKIVNDEEFAKGKTTGEYKEPKKNNSFIKTKIILGSGSASRRAILESAGLKDLDVIVPNVDEPNIGVYERENHHSEKLVKMLAEAKCDAILDMLNAVSSGSEMKTSSSIIIRQEAVDDHLSSDTQYILLTGDSVVTYHGQIREKPSSLEEARRFIAGYSNNCCSTVSAVCVQNLRTGKRAIAVHRATVYFETMPDEIINKLSADREVTQCAGGLMVEHPLVSDYISKIDGGIDAVMGLDVSTVNRLFDEVILPESSI